MVELTKEQALARVRESGYVRIDQGHSATSEKEVEAIFQGRKSAWEKAKRGETSKPEPDTSKAK